MKHIKRLIFTCFRGVVRNNSFWDKLVFRKIQEGMGGHLRLMLVGSAPLSGNVLTFMRCAMGCLVSIHQYNQIVNTNKFLLNHFLKYII